MSSLMGQGRSLSSQVMTAAWPEAWLQSSNSLNDNHLNPDFTGFLGPTKESYNVQLDGAGAELEQPGHDGRLAGSLGQGTHEQHAPLLGGRQDVLHHLRHHARRLAPRCLLHNLPAQSFQLSEG